MGGFESFNQKKQLPEYLFSSSWEPPTAMGGFEQFYQPDRNISTEYCFTFSFLIVSWEPRTAMGGFESFHQKTTFPPNIDLQN